ncbi:MAG: RHS repeat-associated core domain-containing protein [Sandaracinaceae bacterium]
MLSAEYLGRILFGRRTYTYGSRLVPTRITQGSHAMDLEYDALGRRERMTYSWYGSVQRTIRYVGQLYERRQVGTAVEHVYFVMGPQGVVAQVHQAGGGTDREAYFLHADGLGSVVAITNRSGDLDGEDPLPWRSPFGRDLKGDGSFAGSSSSRADVSRGFTGHEHDGELNLINMQGRIYDPVLRRFTAPDPYVSEAFGTQGWNRYSYVQNSPLRRVDPSGYCDGLPPGAPCYEYEDDTVHGERRGGGGSSGEGGSSGGGSTGSPTGSGGERAAPAPTPRPDEFTLANALGPAERTPATTIDGSASTTTSALNPEFVAQRRELLFWTNAASAIGNGLVGMVLGLGEEAIRLTPQGAFLFFLYDRYRADQLGAEGNSFWYDLARAWAPLRFVISLYEGGAAIMALIVRAAGDDADDATAARGTLLGMGILTILMAIISRRFAAARGVGRVAAFPRSTLRGVSLRWLLRNRPRGWTRTATRNNQGFIWRDATGAERLRFMRPSGTNPSGSQWSRQANGYFRWLDEAGNYLDVDGSIVPTNHPLFQELTHIVYEGPPL